MIDRKFTVGYFRLLSFILFLMYSLPSIGQKKSIYETDSLLIIVSGDSLFQQYKELEIVSFKKLSRESESKVETFSSEDSILLNSEDGRRIVTMLREKGIQDPEQFYLRNSKTAGLLKAIFTKYPALKTYPKGILGQMVIYEYRKK